MALWTSVCTWALTEKEKKRVLTPSQASFDRKGEETGFNAQSSELCQKRRRNGFWRPVKRALTETEEKQGSSMAWTNLSLDVFSPNRSKTSKYKTQGFALNWFFLSFIFFAMHIVVGRAFAEHASSLYDNTFLHSFMLLSPSLAFPPCTKSLPHFYIESESDDLFLFPHSSDVCG